MSKYVPAFVKQQQSQVVNQEQQQESNGSIWNRGGNNRFAALSDDFPMNKRDRPFNSGNGSTTMIPATMASLTSSTATSSGGGGKSFASKFSEQMRRAEDPNYVPPPKPLNVNSQDDFPSLGGMPKKSVITPINTPNKALPGAPLKSNTIRQSVMPEQPVPTQQSVNKPTGNKWASMAKAWAQQDEDEREAEHEREVEEERQRREMELLRSMPLPTFNHNKRYNDYDDYDEEYDEDDEYHHHNDKDSFVYESSDTEDGLSDNDRQEGEEGEGEFNSNTVWDGRKKDDLY
jgi:hypothetical protein